MNRLFTLFGTSSMRCRSEGRGMVGETSSPHSRSMSLILGIWVLVIYLLTKSYIQYFAILSWWKAIISSSKSGSPSPSSFTTWSRNSYFSPSMLAAYSSSLNSLLLPITWSQLTHLLQAPLHPPFLVWSHWFSKTLHPFSSGDMDSCRNWISSCSTS